MAQRLGNDLADRHTRIEAGQRVLEDHLHVTAQALPVGRAAATDIAPLKGVVRRP